MVIIYVNIMIIFINIQRIKSIVLALLANRKQEIKGKDTQEIMAGILL